MAVPGGYNPSAQMLREGPPVSMERVVGGAFFKDLLGGGDHEEVMVGGAGPSADEIKRVLDWLCSDVIQQKIAKLAEGDNGKKDTDSGDAEDAAKAAEAAKVAEAEKRGEETKAALKAKSAAASPGSGAGSGSAAAAGTPTAPPAASAAAAGTPTAPPAAAAAAPTVSATAAAAAGTPASAAAAPTVSATAAAAAAAAEAAGAGGAVRHGRGGSRKRKAPRTKYSKKKSTRH